MTPMIPSTGRPEPYPRTAANIMSNLDNLPATAGLPVQPLARRGFMLGAGAAAAAAMLPGTARAELTLAQFNVGTNRPKVASSFDLMPPTSGKDAYIKWMVENRGEDPKALGMRWDRYVYCKANRDFYSLANERSFLFTPRDQFILKRDFSRAYERAFLDIGWGVTISGPLIVARMSSHLDLKPGEKVLEIGTGSGYQSSYLTHQTDKVYTIEIIKPLQERTRQLQDDMIERGYTELKAISSKHADGYYGWQEEAPFDKIIVTCGVDHVPPPLLQQLKPNGLMVIPVGPPGAHVILKVTKQQKADGSIQVARSNVYNGATPFVPFTKLDGDVVKGVHAGGK
jgi:protein-L-isoaspartate(D-aspartate) O-methyltransferase